MQGRLKLREAPPATESLAWQEALTQWADRQLVAGADHLLANATPAFETVMIEAAMRKAGGKRQEAARLLGWGRNTLTRKIKELGLYPGTE